MNETRRTEALRLADALEPAFAETSALLRTLAAEPQEDPGAIYKRGYEEALNDCIRNGIDWARSMFTNNAEHIKQAEPQTYTITWDAQGRRLVNGVIAPEHSNLDAAEPQGEPFAWAVCSINSDSALSLEYTAPWEEAAHDHIFDAIEEDIEGAASWVVRALYLRPAPAQTPQSEPVLSMKKEEYEALSPQARSVLSTLIGGMNAPYKDDWKPIDRTDPRHPLYVPQPQPASDAQPVAWRVNERVNKEFVTGWNYVELEPPMQPYTVAIEPLYLHPAPTQTPLTVMEINNLPEAKGWWPMSLNDRILRLIRAIEAAHGIGGKT